MSKCTNNDRVMFNLSNEKKSSAVKIQQFINDMKQEKRQREQKKRVLSGEERVSDI
ncbi:TPA: hypothetical protein ACGN8S_005502 [Bacillus cereus]